MAMREILSTYRLQLSADFGFDLAREQVGYLADLGVTHLYLSPLLQARRGSTHGYDVADPSKVSDELGGEAALLALAAEAHRAGLGLIVDIVPNHLGTGPDNALWELLLAEGKTGEGGRVFDVDWMPPLPTADGKVILPVLGAQYGEALHRGEIQVVMVGDEPRVRYHDHSFPLSPGSRDAIERAGGVDAINGRAGEPDTFVRLHGLLESQHYRLVWWRVGDGLINYRRFFAIDDLAAVKVEDPHVFDKTHAKILELVAEGIVDGLRIDHPDGLRDPRRYLDRLAERTGGIWTVVEKILHTHEHLPADWKAAGTTGYEFANDVLGLYVDGDAQKAFDELDVEMGGRPDDYDELVLAAKAEKLAGDLAADVQRLARRFWAITQHHVQVRDTDEASCYEVVSRMIARLGVYRTYVDPETGAAGAADVACVREALEAARDGARAPDRLYVLLANVLLGRAGTDPVHLDFLARFQQLSGALTAKGVEDTLFYRYRRLIALNEVGGDPTRFGLTVDEFHRRNAERARRHPAGMLTTDTHDAKRGDDLRLRIAALTEIPDRWTQALRGWRRHADTLGVDPQDASFLFQTMVGIWPSLRDRSDAEIAGRLQAYMEKACREAQERSSWVDPDEEYEGRVKALVDLVLGDDGFRGEMDGVAGAADEIAMVSGVSQTLLRCLSPGVPDTYQGDELWDDSLVDPDNRRPVDFARRAAALGALTAGADPKTLWDDRHAGTLKLWVLHRALRVRRDRPAFVGVDAGYEPLVVSGMLAEHVVAFARTDAAGAAGIVAIAPRLPGRVMGEHLDAPAGQRWADTAVGLPDGDWTDALTGRTVSGGTVGLGDVLAELPVAVLTTA